MTLRSDTYNKIHKKLIVLYPEFNHISEIWDSARHDFKQSTNITLSVAIFKTPQLIPVFNSWVRAQMKKKKLEHKEFVNKGDLKERGWNDKLINHYKLVPDKIIALGRGRKVYYYDIDRLVEMEVSEEFYLLKQRRKKEPAQKSLSTSLSIS